MIKLIFSINRETFYIEIENKEVTYKDRKLKVAIQMIPLPSDYMKIIIFSRNRIPKYIIELMEGANEGKNKEEYDLAKDDEELVPIIKWDCANKGCKFEKRVDSEGVDL